MMQLNIVTFTVSCFRTVGLEDLQFVMSQFVTTELFRRFSMNILMKLFKLYNNMICGHLYFESSKITVLILIYFIPYVF